MFEIKCININIVLFVFFCHRSRLRMLEEQFGSDTDDDDYVPEGTIFS